MYITIQMIQDAKLLSNFVLDYKFIYNKIMNAYFGKKEKSEKNEEQKRADNK